MADVNIVVIAGRLTRDPEMRYTPNGTAVARLGVAIGRRWKDQQSGQMREETTFVDVEVYGRQAEVSSQYLAKGRSVLIEGGLRLDQWEDKQTGQKRSKMKVVGNRVHFLGGPGEGGGRSKSGGGEGAPARSGGQGGRGRAADKVAEDAPPPSDENLDIPEDDIPF